jgi:GIY-YIG catalytic domain
MKFYVYTLEHPVTHEIRYIGKTNNLKLRVNHHNCPSKYTHKENWIRSLHRMNLRPIIEVLEEYDSKELCTKAEIYWISQFKVWGFNLLNLTNGGEGRSGFSPSIEQRQHVSEVLKERYSKEHHKNKGRKLSEEHKRALSKASNHKPTYGFLGKIHPSRKLVAIFKDGKKIDEVLGLLQTCQKYNLDFRNACNVCNGKAKTVKGFTLQYINHLDLAKPL